MGAINFVRRFVPNFAQIVKPLQQMVKKRVQFRWTDIEKVTFKDIKETIAHVPSLRILYFQKDFILYTFSLDNSIVAVLTQKGELGDQYPISVMRNGLQGDALKYPAVDKHAYAEFKVVKQFGTYILKNRTKVIIPLPDVKSLFVEK